MSNAINELYVTEEAVCVFPHLFEAKPIVVNGQPQGDPLYSVTLLFEPEDVKELKKVAARLAQQKWPGRELKTLQFPFKSGDREADRMNERGKNGEIYRGYVVCKASSKYAPGVVGPDKQTIIDPSQVYSGCMVRAQLNVKPYSAGANEGVKLYLNHIMKTRDGERLIGSSPQDAFSGVQGVSTNTDPTEGATDPDDDMLPF
jgi:hypothetical protein